MSCESLSKEGNCEEKNLGKHRTRCIDVPLSECEYTPPEEEKK